jgi:hypothetical protein
LSDEQIEQLFADLVSQAQVQEVLAKTGPRNHSDQGRLSLSDAKHRLLSGAVRAIQVRYQFEDTEWNDTLIRVPGGTRLVRCKSRSEMIQ